MEISIKLIDDDRIKSSHFTKSVGHNVSVPKDIAYFFLKGFLIFV